MAPHEASRTRHECDWPVPEGAGLICDDLEEAFRVGSPDASQKFRDFRG